MRTLERPAGEVLAPEYLTTKTGDLYAKLIDGREEPIDPDAWGWHSDSPESRCGLEQVRTLPGFTVTVRAEQRSTVYPGLA